MTTSLHLPSQTSSHNHPLHQQLQHQPYHIFAQHSLHPGGHRFKTKNINHNNNEDCDIELISVSTNKGSSNYLPSSIQCNRPQIHLLPVKFKTENSNRVTYFIMSVLVMIFFNLPLGFMALLCSMKSHSLLQQRTPQTRERARHYGWAAFVLNMLGIFVTMTTLIFLFRNQYIYGGDNLFPGSESSAVIGGNIASNKPSIRGMRQRRDSFQPSHFHGAFTGMLTPDSEQFVIV